MLEEAKDGVVEMTEIGFCHVHDLGDSSGKVHSRVHSVTADQTSTRRMDQFFTRWDVQNSTEKVSVDECRRHSTCAFQCQDSIFFTSNE